MFFEVLIPVRADNPKSRLGGEAWQRSALMSAFAQDAVAACVEACRSRQLGRVTVVGDVDWATVLGAEVVPDPGTGLAGAIDAGRASLAAAAPTAVLFADLPCLRPVEVANALAAARSAGQLCFVPDHEGTGTTFLAAPRSDQLTHRFGVGSAALHAQVGAVALEGDWPGLRLDVDTPADLAAAVRLGVGPRTAAVLAETDDGDLR